MKQLGEITVAEYMTSQVIVVQETVQLVEAIRLMEDNRLSVVPVVNEQNKLVGILSNSDLVGMMHELQSDLRALNKVKEETREFFIRVLTSRGDRTLVRDVMTSPVEIIPVNANLIVAAQKLHASHYHHLPVVDDDGDTVGVIASSDFVRAIAEKGALATSD